MTSKGQITLIHMEDTSMEVTISTRQGIKASEALSRSGLAPRDGSMAHLHVDGKIAHPDTMLPPGSVVYIDNESVIETVLIDHTSFKSGKRVVGAGQLYDGTIAHVPGARRGEFHWVVRHIQHKSGNGVVHAQCHSFRVEGQPYQIGDLVRASPSPDGKNALLFDPESREWTKLLTISMPPNMDPEEVRDLYRGLLWTIRITDVEENMLSGMLIPALTHNPRIAKRRKQ